MWLWEQVTASRDQISVVYVGLKLFVCRFLQKEWREDPTGVFKKKVARCVRKSQEMAFD